MTNNKIGNQTIYENQLAFSIIQIAKLTSLSKSMIHSQIALGNLKIFHCGRRTLATKAAIDAWLDYLAKESK